MTRVIRHARFSDIPIPVGQQADLVEDVETEPLPGDHDSSEGEFPGAFDPQLAAAEREAQVEEAYHRGLAAGREEGRQAAEEELLSSVNSMACIAEQLAAERETILREARDLVVHLSCAIAQRILEVSALVSDSGVVDLVTRAASHAKDRGSLTVRVHPDDLDVVRRFCPEPLAGEGSAGKVAFEGDASISRGGCIVDTDSGIVDGRLESQLNVFREELLGKVRSE